LFFCKRWEVKQRWTPFFTDLQEFFRIINFAPIFRDFAQIFSDFVQIFRDLDWIFNKSKLFRVRLDKLHPRLLHHCSEVLYPNYTLNKVEEHMGPVIGSRCLLELQ